MRALALLLASCTTFEDPTVVIDMRVIAMTAEPPEQVVDIDPAKPDLIGALDQIQPSFVCATVADPARAGSLTWSMRACLFDNGRCDPERPSFELGGGEIPDPEASPSSICAPIVSSPDLLAVLVDSVMNDEFGGAAGVTYTVEFQIRPTGGSDDQAIFGSKDLHVFARFPADRTPNHNPALSGIQLESPPEVRVPLVASCASELPRASFRSRQLVTIFPIELDGTRENYPVAAIDGSFQYFDETLTYQFLTTAGSLADEFTGGLPDFVGNIPPINNDWIAPETDHPLDVQLWMIQRDERGGVAVYPICIHVEP